ncbi:MAG: hypothetical protein KF831_15355 [Acidobacteria bacterium]|nr:hypothetical protein [Acidobacteriota bacterium]
MENPAVEVTTVTQTIVSASASELGTTINQRPISQEVVTSNAATLSDHLVSAGGTIAENTGVQALLDFAGLNPPETEHTTAGRVIGHGLSLGIALGEIAVGASLIAAGTGGNLFGVGLDLTGVGAAVGVPVHAVSTAAIATGAAIGFHGVFTAGNTSVNIYNQAKGKNEGVYEFPDADTPGTDYVGQSNDTSRRIAQHERSGRKSRDSKANVKAVPGGKTKREMVEQGMIDKKGGIKGGKVSNIRNPISEKRKKKLGIK